MMSLKSCLSFGCLSVVIAHSPSFDELEAACAGVAPGRPGRSCRKLLAQDGNAGAERCFSQDRAEVAFHECYRQICEDQGRTCSGEGGQHMCTGDCMKLAVRRFDNLNRLTHWKVYQPEVVQNASFLASEVPSFADLQFACSGFTPGQHDEDCTRKRLLDTNLKARTCFEKNPSDEAAFQKCCDQFCTVQGRACTGHQGSELCFKECQEKSHSQYGNMKGIALHAQSQPLATQNASFLMFSEVPSFADLQFACSGFTPGQHNKDCTVKRLLDTNLKAQTCFEKNPEEAAFQKCCDQFCTIQGKACTGHKGSELCSKECQDYSHSQYGNMKGVAFHAQPQEASRMALSQHHSHMNPKLLSAPTTDELQSACRGVGSEDSCDECLVVRMRDSNARTSTCFMTTPDDESAYRSCCVEFCGEQSKSCTGHGGHTVCNDQCVEYGESLFKKLKVLASLKEFAGMTSTTGAPSSTTPKASSSSNKASHAALAQHKVALRHSGM